MTKNRILQMLPHNENNEQDEEDQYDTDPIGMDEDFSEFDVDEWDD